MKVICLDRAHGVNTYGKRSPGAGELREWEMSDKLVDLVAKTLKERHPELMVVDLVPENTDVPLTTRAKRVNSYCDKYGTDNVICVSIHLNAAGNGSQWTGATGWEVWTSPGKTKADDLATCLFKAADELLPPRFTRRADWSDGDPDKEARFTILTATKCAAALTENLFMDSTKDFPYLMSPEGLETIAMIHVRGIENHFKL